MTPIKIHNSNVDYYLTIMSHLHHTSFMQSMHVQDFTAYLCFGLIKIYMWFETNTKTQIGACTNELDSHQIMSIELIEPKAVPHTIFG